MLNGLYKKQLESILDDADIKIGGSRAWDIHVHRPELYRRALTHGNLGLGEAYMEGWWDCDRLDEFFYRLIGSRAEDKITPTVMLIGKVLSKLYNMQRPARAFQVAEKHYNIGNDLFKAMLDKRMLYSCAYWKDAGTLEAAQTAKIDLVCRKLGLKPGMKVLDIGCGWGGAAAYAAEQYGVEVVGVTISRNQADAARLRCANLPVEIRFGDYRNVTGRFDRIYSIGMFEHVGARNHRPYLAKVRELLAPDGLTLLHTIGNRVTLRANDPWIEKYIFPNSLIPSRAQIALAAERLFVIEDWHDFGTDYERTLAAWADNLRDAWPDLAPRYDDRFRRMWHFYLMVSIASFRARRSQLWQIVMSPEGVTGEYRPVR